MSSASLQKIMERIKDAPQCSPIAVFNTGYPNKLDAQFANTTENLKRIHLKDPALVGVFHSGMNGGRTRELLQKAMKKNMEAPAE